MLAALDVHYHDASHSATGAAVVFDRWDAAEPTAEYTACCSDVQPYEPGNFFKRELPCLLAVHRLIREPIDVLIIDGYVQLGDQPGLGMRLHEALAQDATILCPAMTNPSPAPSDATVAEPARTLPAIIGPAIIGVAKTPFHAATAVEVTRGRSRTPLYVTALGIELKEAAQCLRTMHGQYRLPTLLKRVDGLGREGQRCL